MGSKPRFVMNVVKLQPVHAVVNNAPLIISVLSDQAPCTSRFFCGAGAPGASTLLAGNGKYNAALHGWIISASLNAGGSGYAVNDTCTVGACTIIVDAVAAGAIVDFHVSAYGNYSSSPYPANPVAVSGTSGAGAGASFNLNWPSPDFYLDMTTPTSPVLWVCQGAGSNTGATWAQITGGGGGNYAGTWSYTTSYTAGQIVRVESTATIGGVTPTLGVYGCISTVPASGAGNEIPQYPEPTSGTKYWQLIAFGVQEIGVCTGTSQNAYINATGPF